MTKAFSAIRRQSDDEQDLYSLEAGLDLSGEVDLARQEFREEADVNSIMRKYGVGGLNARQPQYGEQDFDVDLQHALRAIADAKAAHARLSPELRAKYKNWKSMLDAAASGELQEDLKDPPSEPARPDNPPTGSPIPDPQ